MLDFTYGMIHCYLEEEQITSSGDVYQRQNKVKFWINVMQHNMEDTLQRIEQKIKINK